VNEIYLQPGEMYFGVEPARVSTLLGSCISVTMFCSRLKTGAICHALLPGNGTACVNPQDIFRYVDTAIPYMMERYADMGIKEQEIEAKLFGGADVLEISPARSNSPSVGKMNINTARGILSRIEIPIRAYDVGGKQGRKIIYYPHTGEVFMKRLTATGSIFGRSGSNTLSRIQY
jgi:chemotaxis protein CheD